MKNIFGFVEMFMLSLISKPTTMNQVFRTDLETNEQELVSMDFAIDKLSSYWDKNNIEQILKSGQDLWTPYAIYSINNNKNQPQ
jgi:hypothetical protein